MSQRQTDTRHQLEVARQVMAERKDALEALAQMDAAWEAAKLEEKAKTQA